MKIVITKQDDGMYEWTLVDENGNNASWSNNTYSRPRDAERGAHRWLWKLCGNLSTGSIQVVVDK